MRFFSIPLFFLLVLHDCEKPVPPTKSNAKADSAAKVAEQRKIDSGFAVYLYQQAEMEAAKAEAARQEEEIRRVVEEQLALENTARQTRVRFPEFTVLIHNFMGYSIDEISNTHSGQEYSLQFGTGMTEQEAELNNSESDREDYKETLIAKKDTIHLSEQLFDDRIDNTLIQILPNSPDDRYTIEFCYTGYFYETFDWRGLSNAEMEEKSSKVIYIPEKSKGLKLPDSALYFFRAMPHTPDMVPVKVENGQIVQEKFSHTEAQRTWEENYMAEDIIRIKTKYKLHDTLVTIPGEYETTINLTRNRKLYCYGPNAYLFRIDRYRNKKKLGSKYISIGIASGC